MYVMVESPRCLIVYLPISLSLYLLVTKAEGGKDVAGITGAAGGVCLALREGR